MRILTSVWSTWGKWGYPYKRHKRELFSRLMLCFLMAWLYCSLRVSKPRERSSFWLQSAKHVQGQTKTHEPQACCWAAPLASFTHSQVLPPFQITSPLFQIITRFDFSRYIGYVRLEEFWRNFDGFEECWRNLWEKNTVPDKKKEADQAGFKGTRTEP